MTKLSEKPTIRISDDQNTVTTIAYGTARFTETSIIRQKCTKCVFFNEELAFCEHIPCMREDREDGLNGYFIQ